MPRFWLLTSVMVSLPSVAFATTYDDFRCVEQVGNVLRYTCTATTSSDRVRVKFWLDGTTDYRYSAYSEPGTDHSFTIWGLKPGTRYRYTVASATDEAPTSRVFTTDALDEEFGPPFDDMVIRTSTRPGGSPWTNYVLFNVACGSIGQNYVIIDREGDVVWYEKPGNESITAFTLTDTGTLLGIVGNEFLHEISLDGTVLRELDMAPNGECTRGLGPCPHHDIVRDGEHIWAVTSHVDYESYDAMGLTGCEDKTAYIIDGFTSVHDDDPWSVDEAWQMDTDFGYEPDLDLGPDFDPSVPIPKCSPNSWNGTLEYEGKPPIDYTHINTFWVRDEFVWVSNFNWDQMVKLHAPSRTTAWKFHSDDPDYSDFAVPINVSPTITANNTASIVGFHHIFTWEDDTMQMYNNQQTPNYTRVIRVKFDEATMQATLQEAFTMVDDSGGTYVSPRPLTCTQVGSAYNMGDGSHVLAPCASLGSVAELDRNDGTWTDGPLWYAAVTCDGRPVGPPDFYRAIPLDTLDP